MRVLNWRIIVVGMCLASAARPGLADLDTPPDAPAPIVKKPAAKHPKKHHKAVKEVSETPSETPKVMALSNDDLPKRHNYYSTPDSAAQPVAPATPASSFSNASVPKSAATTPPPTPAAAATTTGNPIAVDANAPKIAPTSDPTDLPTPGATAIHSSNDLTKEPPTTKIH